MTDSPRKAILVIHGIGQQNPFETLDSFTRGFLPVAENHYSVQYTLEHRQVPRTGRGSWESWQQYYLALQSDSAPCIDVYEHYWAYRMTEQASLSDIVDWLERASRYARNFYDAQAGGVDIRDKVKDIKDSRLNRLFEPGTGRFHANGYLRLLGWGMPLVLKAMAYLEESFVPSNAILSFIYKYFLQKLKTTVIDYVGDIAVYTQTDRKAKHFVVRQKMLLEARMAVEALLADPRYDSVIVAGHSLGSVVAYDTLNRLHKAPPLTGEDNANAVEYGRLTGLVTFGSPLDKTYFFFRETVTEEEWVRGQFLDDLHSFMRRPSPPGQDKGRAIEDETAANLHGVTWLNFYDRLDPVSGHLDVYDADNIEVKTGAAFGVAHTAYWQHEPMYEAILDKLLP